jgi:hypothetical protein
MGRHAPEVDAVVFARLHLESQLDLAIYEQAPRKTIKHPDARVEQTLASGTIIRQIFKTAESAEVKGI